MLKILIRLNFLIFKALVFLYMNSFIEQDKGYSSFIDKIFAKKSTFLVKKRKKFIHVNKSMKYRFYFYSC